MTALRRWWPLLLLVAVLPLAFPGALPGPRVVSADDHLTVHPAFQEVAGGRVRHPAMSDPALQFEALENTVVDALREGQAPLWNPDLFLGTDLLADAQSRPLYPGTLARLVFAEDTAQDIGVGFILLWVGLGTALLLSSLGLGVWPAVGGAIAAMTGPMPFVWLLHPHASTYCWLPWALLAIERRRVSWMALAVVGLASGGHPGTMLHVAMIALVWWACRARSLATAVGALIGALLSAPLTLPVLEAVLTSSTVAARGHTPLHPSQLLDIIWPSIHGHPARGGHTGAGIWADGQLHAGFGALLVMGVGCARAGAARRAGLAYAACVVAALLPLPGPVDHGRLAQVGALFVAVGAGYGLSVIRGRAVQLGAIGLILWTGLWARRDDQASLSHAEHHPPPAAWTAALQHEVGCSEDPAALSCRRVLGLDWMLQPNTGSRAGLRDVRGYDLPVHRDTWALMNRLSQPARGPWFPVASLPETGLLKDLGVGAVVTAPDVDLELEEIELPRAPVRAWRVPDSRPRAWVAGEVVSARNATEAMALLGRSGERVPVEQEIRLSQSATSSEVVGFEHRGSAEFLIRVQSHGLLVVNESWRSGWRASVDGVPTSVIRVGGALIGVVLPEGADAVELYFRPDGWIWGQRLFVLGGVIWILIVGSHRWGLRREKYA